MLTFSILRSIWCFHLNYLFQPMYLPLQRREGGEEQKKKTYWLTLKINLLSFKNTKELVRLGSSKKARTYILTLYMLWDRHLLCELRTNNRKGWMLAKQHQRSQGPCTIGLGSFLRVIIWTPQPPGHAGYSNFLKRIKWRNKHRGCKKLTRAFWTKHVTFSKTKEMKSYGSLFPSCSFF